MDYILEIDKLNENNQILFMENAINVFQLQPLSEAFSPKELWNKFITFAKEKVLPFFRKIINNAINFFNRVTGRTKDAEENVDAILKAQQELRRLAKQKAISQNDTGENKTEDDYYDLWGLKNINIDFYDFNEKYQKFDREVFLFGLEKINKVFQKDLFDSFVKMSNLNPNEKVKDSDKETLNKDKKDLDLLKSNVENLGINEPIDCLDKEETKGCIAEMRLDYWPKYINMAKDEVTETKKYLSDTSKMYQQMNKSINDADRSFRKYEDQEDLTEYQKFTISYGTVILNQIIMIGKILRTKLQVLDTYINLNNESIKKCRIYVERAKKKAAA